MKKAREERQERKSPNEAAKKIADLIATVQHTQADFENYKKRVMRDKEDFQKTAKKDMLLSLLGIMDNFELALNSFKGEKNDVFKGFEMIYSQLLTLLQQEGVSVIKENAFDPALHEPLLQEKGEEDGKILETLQKGYYLHNKVLRTAKVKISKK